jgi:hypothetical protein
MSSESQTGETSSGIYAESNTTKVREESAPKINELKYNEEIIPPPQNYLRGYEIIIKSRSRLELYTRPAELAHDAEDGRHTHGIIPYVRVCMSESTIIIKRRR